MAYLQLGEAILELRRVRRDRFTQNDTNLSCFADADRAIIAADAALYRACQALAVLFVVLGLVGLTLFFLAMLG
ncbi:MAG: hypothetical protein K1X94_05365 [Sandaracinaceae bacterium]|nr:hypothetical protein [Sandaracinaceae bacterium]